MKFAVALEALSGPFRIALSRAEKLDVSAVQWDAVGELSPKQLTDTGRRAIEHLLRSHHLTLAGLVCPLRRGLDDPVDLDPRIARIIDAMTLTAALGATVTVIDPGPIPTDAAALATLVEALGALARHGDRVGAILALVTGSVSGAALKELLARFDSGGLGVALAPARWLHHRFDPLAEMPAIAARIVHVLAEDARRRGGMVALGSGDVDWLAIAGALAARDYRGAVVVERDGIASEADALAAVRFLKRII